MRASRGSCSGTGIVDHVLHALSIPSTKGSISWGFLGVNGYSLSTSSGTTCHAQGSTSAAVGAKRARARVVEYLEPEQVRVVLAQPDRRTQTGVRDHALLLLLFNTGARVSEVLSITREDLHLSPPRHVRLHGKGKKERICPLWPDTAAAMRQIVLHQGSTAGAVFRNTRGDSLSRDGVAYILDRHVAAAAAKTPGLRRRRVTPHVFRHSCAVALLQAGVDLTVIRDYLGHASVATTGRYVATNVSMKREALEAFWRRAGIASGRTGPWRPKSALLDFLSSL